MPEQQPRYGVFESHPARFTNREAWVFIDHWRQFEPFESHPARAAAALLVLISAPLVGAVAALPDLNQFLASGTLVKVLDLALPGYGFYPLHAFDHPRRAVIEIFVEWISTAAQRSIEARPQAARVSVR